jgi:tRNA pseudouridine38-40 synthase
MICDYNNGMKTWKLTVEYDGTKYHGWQEQINARTVQGELRKAVEEVLGQSVEMQGSGRTDSGVHALAQVVHVKVDRSPRLPVNTLHLARQLNGMLPADIAVIDAAEAKPGFHARHDAVSRTYLYQISTRKTAFAKRYVWWIKETLDAQAMARAASLLPGRHDFAAFAAKDPSRPDESTIVVVNIAEVGTEDHLILFRIEASHYLWKMVRRIVGVLVGVGKGQVTEEQVAQLLGGRPIPGIDIAANTAPAAGLFLEEVRYKGSAK